MQEIKLNDIADGLLILNKITIDKLFQLENSADCIALYVFYYKTAKWQKTNVIKASDEYVKKCLKWGNDKIRKTKQTLKENGLINIVQARTDNKISGWYIEVCYLVSEKSMENIDIKVLESKNTQTQQVANATSSNEDTNALKEYIKCLKKEIEVLKERKKEGAKTQNSFDEIFKNYTQDEETIQLLGEWLKVRKAKRAALTDKSIILNIQKLNKLAEESNLSVNEYLEEAIRRGWTAFFPIKEYRSKSAPKEESTGNVFLDIMKDEGLL